MFTFLLLLSFWGCPTFVFHSSVVDVGSSATLQPQSASVAFGIVQKKPQPSAFEKSSTDEAFFPER